MDNTLGNWEIYFKRSTAGGTTFGNTANLSNSAGFTNIQQYLYLEIMCIQRGMMVFLEIIMIYYF